MATANVTTNAGVISDVNDVPSVLSNAATNGAVPTKCIRMKSNRVYIKFDIGHVCVFNIIIICKKLKNKLQ